MNIRYFVLTLLMGCAAWSSSAQNYTTTKTAGKKALEAYQKGKDELYQGHAEKAIQEFDKALKFEPEFIDAQLLWADAHIGLKDYDAAQKGFERVIALDPNYDPKVYYVVAKFNHDRKRYDLSASYAEKHLAYKNLSPEVLAKSARILEEAKFRSQAIANPQPFQPQNLGGNINTKQREYAPVITADGSTLIFTTLLGEGPTAQEDFYIAKKAEQEGWEKASPIGPPINTFENEGAQSVSADGRTLVYTACNREGDYGSCDLYMTTINNGVWGTPTNMGASVNTRAWESQPAISANGDVLLFTSNRASTLGGKDLYITQRLPNGSWAEPQNMGSNINTAGDEGAPFLHPDGQTLYFRSNGLVGMGDHDLFIVRKQADGSWGTPQNIGYPINTEKEEGGLVVSLDGRTAYFHSDRPGGFGLQDIYAFELPNSSRPQPVTYVRCFVKDASGNQPLAAQLSFVDLSNNQVLKSGNSDAQGTFLVCLPAGRQYALNVGKSGYILFSENYNFEEIRSFDAPLTAEIKLNRLPDEVVQSPIPSAAKRKQAVILRNVFFETASAELKPNSKVELDNLKDFLDDNPEVRIQINGHTDDVGEESDNLSLSERRAQAVRSYLIQAGIPATRLTAKGYGESEPIALNSTAEGRAQNRRTEFEIVN